MSCRAGGDCSFYRPGALRQLNSALSYPICAPLLNRPCRISPRTQRRRLTSDPGPPPIGAARSDGDCCRRASRPVRVELAQADYEGPKCQSLRTRSDPLAARHLDTHGTRPPCHPSFATHAPLEMTRKPRFSVHSRWPTQPQDRPRPGRCARQC